MSSPAKDRRPDTGSPRPLEAETSWIVEVEARTFEREIIERSASVPVVVDFWASWCGPCKTLTPLLEKRAREGNGRFVLAKVDIDRSPELAQAFRVQAVPTVLAIVQGRLADGFQGALAEKELDEFLERIAPGRGPHKHSDTQVDRALAIIKEGKREQGIGLLRELLREKPDHVAARFALAETLIDAGKTQDAKLVLEKVPVEEAESERGRALRTRLEFAQHAGDLAKLEEDVRSRPDDLAARIQLGKAYVAAHDYERGLENLLEVVRRDPTGAGKEAKTAMLEVFGLLGLEDPVANDYRFKLSLELFN